MLDLSMVIDEAQPLFSCLIDFHDRPIQNEGAVIALSLQGLTIHVGCTSERTVDQCAMSPNRRGLLLLLFLLTSVIKIFIL